MAGREEENRWYASAKSALVKKRRHISDGRESVEGDRPVRIRTVGNELKHGQTIRVPFRRFGAPGMADEGPADGV